MKAQFQRASARAARKAISYHSSLSYNTHAVVAALLGRTEQAYAYFHRCAGMDLDNLHDATRDGLHAASQGGSWQAIVMGFGGMTATDKGLDFRPHFPPAWKALRFRAMFQGRAVRVTLTPDTRRVEPMPPAESVGDG